MKFLLNKDKLTIEELNDINSGSVNYYKADVEHDESWNTLSIEAVLVKVEDGELLTESAVSIAVINNEMYIDRQKSGLYVIGFKGYTIVDEVKNYQISTNFERIWLDKGAGEIKTSNSESIPTEWEIYLAQVQEFIDNANEILDNAEDITGQMEEALEDVNTAIEQTNNLDIDANKVNKTTTVSLTKKDGSTKTVQIADGLSLEFMWQGTSLGIRVEGQGEYTFVDLQGIQGPVGPQGEAFQIKKTYPSVAEMNADFNNMQLGDYVMIASTVEVEDNAKLYTRGESQWIFISDFSGAQGIRGPVGATPNITIGTVVSGDTPNVTRSGTDENPVLNFTLVKGDKGDTGATGATGNGISSVEVVAETSSEKTLRINFTDGTYFDFTLENGEVTQAQLDEVIELNERILNNTPKGTTNTNPATMNDSADLPLNKFVLDGKTEQGADPSPSNPQEIKNVEGKNKINTNKNPDFLYASTSYERNGYNIIVKNNTGTNPEYAFAEYYIDGLKPNKKYTISFNAKIKTNGTISADVLNKRNDAGSASTRLLRLDGTSTSQRLVGTFTTPNDTSILSLNLYSLRGTEYSNAEVEYSNIQIEEGEEETSYNAYNCIQIKKCNKNFCKLGEPNLLMGSDGIIQSSIHPTTIINTKNINSLYISGNFNLLADNVLRLGGCNEYPVLGGTGTRLDNINSNQAVNVTNYNYILLTWVAPQGMTEEKKIAIENSFQVEEGTTGSNWVAHAEKTYNFPLSEGQVLMQDGKIEDNFKNTKAHKIYTTEDYDNFTDTYTNLNSVSISKPTDDIKYGNVTRDISIICDKALYSTRPNGYDDVDLIGKIYDGGSGSYNIGLPKAVTTLAQAQTYLGILEIEYPLATPDETEFTQAQKDVIDEIKKDGTYKEVTHYTAEASLNPDMEIGYYKDLETLFNNLQNS